MNIPIYRAKKIDSDEYVEGCLIGDKRFNHYEIMKDGTFERYVIDLTTISIYHQDMLASDSNRILPNGEKDLRIFASLQEDGKGGDILEIYDLDDLGDINRRFIYIYNGNTYAKEVTPIRGFRPYCNISMLELNKTKVIEIKQ